MIIPQFEGDCEDCEGGWCEPLDMPNDPVLAALDMEPCPECAAGKEAQRWFDKNREWMTGRVG